MSECGDQQYRGESPETADPAAHWDSCCPATSEMRYWSENLNAPLPSPMLSKVLAGHRYHGSAQIGLMRLLELHEIQESSEAFATLQDTNQWLIEQTQRHFLRQGERWDPENQAKEEWLSKDRKQVLQAVSLMGLTQRVIPDQSALSADRITILPGALETRVTQRLNSVVEEIQHSNRPPCAVVVATGKRALLDYECPDATLSERTEAAMIRYRWNEAKECHPELANIPFHVCEAQLKDGQVRSKTVDTVEALGEHEVVRQLQQRNGCAVVHIEQPYAKRFALLFHGLGLRMHVYAQAVATDTPLFLYLDETARTIFARPHLTEG
eukprot:gb/GECG01001546.1/.p1 GENE.gb/GECG01001546.1/~~gb/GECG01001546.1/.p1  ORF type:complete len:325 (+),score=34.07 gb/GECG01001546.1/:1-975(+)